MDLALGAAILKMLPQLKQGEGVSIQLPKDFPPQLLGTVQKMLVAEQLPDNELMLQLLDGSQVKAKVEPQLPVGTRLTLLAKSPTDVLLRQLLPPASDKPALPPKAVLPATNPTTLTAQLKTLAFPPQQRPVLPLQLPQTSLNTGGNATTFTATVLTPPTPQGEQTFQITLPRPPQASQPLPTTPAATGTNTPAPTLTTQATPPQPLPVGTTLTVIQTPNQPPQIVELTLPTPPQAAPANPTPPPPTTQASAPAPTPTAQPTAPTLPQPGQVQVTLPTTPLPTSQLSQQTELTLTLNAPPANSNGPVQQTAPLPNGGQAVVNLPQAVPEGTHMTIRLGADGLPQVLRVTSDISHHQSNTTGQQNTPQHQTPMPSLAAGSQLKGIITAQAPNNTMTLSLNTGHTLQVQADRPLPTGTQVTVTIQADGHAEIQDLTLPTGSTRADSAYRFSKEWPLLKQALNTLKSHAPEAAARLSHTLPRPDTLLPTLIQFADALQQQSAERLLGDDTANMLRALGIDLTPDIQSLHHLQQRPETQDGWRAMLFPYVENEGEDPQQGGFFWRRQKKEDEQNESSLRFIMQLSLSQYGAMQLDGLMNEKNISLKLYLHQEPGNTFRQGLSELVTNTLAAHGLQGSIQILTTPTFPTEPLAEIQHHAGHMNFTA